MFDDQDREIVDRAGQVRLQRNGLFVGDWVNFLEGTRHRIAAIWDDSVQTCPGGSFYLGSGGGCDFSGQPRPSISSEALTPAGYTEPAPFWIFHHGLAGAGRGIDVDAHVAVWNSSIEHR